MKKVSYLGLALGLGLVVAGTATISLASQFTITTGRNNIGGAGIVGSSHDLSGSNLRGSATSHDASAMVRDGGDYQKRICVYCHHPHNAVKAGTAGIAYSPLWNRGKGSGTFIPYNNSDTTLSPKNSMMQSVSGSTGQHMMNGTPSFGGVSLLCMSCHDGVTAMNAYSEKNPLGLGGTGITTAGIYASTGTAPATTGEAGPITNSAGLALGTGTFQNLSQGDMSNHHPVGLDWSLYNGGLDSEIAHSDSKFIDKASLVGNTLAAITEKTGSALKNPTLRKGKTIGEVLSNGKMECVTCHDVHNSGNDAGAERLLWVSDDFSALCLSCHLK